MEWFSISLQKCTVYEGKIDINIKQIMKGSAETHTNLDVHIIKQLKLGASSDPISKSQNFRAEPSRGSL